MKEVEQEFIEIKKEIAKCYKQNKVTKKISWLSLPIALTILIISKLTPPLEVLNVIPIFLTSLNFLVTPTFNILNKINKLTNTIKNEKDNLELDKIKNIYFEIKKFYTIPEIPVKYIWISILTIFISMVGVFTSNYLNLIIPLLGIIPIVFIPSLILSIKENHDGEKLVQELRNITRELENKEKKQYFKVYSKPKTINTNYVYQDSYVKEKPKVLKKIR